VRDYKTFAGRATARKLSDAFDGADTCKELRLRSSLADLRGLLGPKFGAVLHQRLRGHDDRALDVDHERRSVSAEVNYGIRFTHPDEMTG